MTNLLGVFFASYPTTASFSATALKAKCHVPTPLSGLFTSALIILSLYALTGAFYYVPTAGLAAVIISSSTGLVDGSEGIHYWHISRIEAVIWVSSVIATLLSGVQYGISIAIVASLALLLVRIAKPQGEFLGTATLKLIDGKGRESTRQVFIPLNLGDEGVHNINTVVKPPAPWIVIYRLGESFTYPNASSVNMSIMEYFKENGKRTPGLFDDGKKTRLWNDTEVVDAKSKDEREKRRRPIRAVILDFASVCVYLLWSSNASLSDLLCPLSLRSSVVDSTGVQILRDTRAEVERWTGYTVDVRPLSMALMRKMCLMFPLLDSSTSRISTGQMSTTFSSRGALGFRLQLHTVHFSYQSLYFPVRPYQYEPIVRHTRRERWDCDPAEGHPRISPGTRLKDIYKNT